MSTGIQGLEENPIIQLSVIIALCPTLPHENWHA